MQNFLHRHPFRLGRPPHRTRRCKNCLIHISRDVHVDLSSVKRRFPHDDISKHAFEVEFFDRSSSDVSMFCVLYRGRFVF